jgi:hypothetical protein
LLEEFWVWFIPGDEPRMMVVVEAINWFFNVANKALDIVLPWVLLFVLLVYPVFYLVRGIRKANKETQAEKKQSKLNDTFSGTFILFFTSIAIFGIFWGFPEFIYLRTGLLWPVLALRWIIFSITFIVIAYIFCHDYGENRWKISVFGHIAVIFMGWLVQEWMGILIISLPLLVAYYCSLYNLAIIILPTSDPESPAEKRKRFLILVSYAWGVQRSIIAVEEHAWKKPEVRIPGDISHDLPIPGLVWTRSHQVVGITSGMKFKSVDGPGLVFTNKLERPLQIMDLRSQIRSAEIDVISKDGIAFKAIIFTAFRLDPEPWDQETYETLRRLNPALRGADTITHTLGSFPFSHLRIQAAIGITSSKSSGDVPIYWDQWVLSVIERETRKVISQKNLDELWRPLDDKKGINALDDIAARIKDNAYLALRSAGILVLVARVVNFRFSSEKGLPDGISEQQITTWGSEWERKRTNILADAQAESDRYQQEARAYAESLLLNAIAEGLQKTEEIDPNLPHYVIAMRFLSALQDLVHRQTGEDDSNPENASRMMEVQNRLLNWRNQIGPGSNKEKQS